MPHRNPRAVVHCILRRADEALLIRLVERDTGRVAWRAPGGGIEWRETSEQAVRREVLEEVGVELEAVRLLQIVEAMGRWNGNDEHELIFLFEADARPSAVLDGQGLASVEGNGEPLDLRWVRGRELVAEGAELYPSALARFLE